MRLEDELAYVQRELDGARSVQESMAQEAAALEGIAGRVSQSRDVLGVDAVTGRMLSSACWRRKAWRCSPHLRAAAPAHR